MILYSTGCPKCKVLEAKLNSKHIKFDICDSVEKMQELGFNEAPMLQFDNGDIMDFIQAVSWVNKV